MQTRTLPEEKSVTVPSAETHSRSNEMPPTRRGGGKTASRIVSKPKVSKVAANGSASKSKANAKSSKRAKYSFPMPQVEHEAIVALKHKLSEVGSKVKKSDIVRAGVLLLLSLPDSKVRASLGKISAINGSQKGRKA
jgi:hypothetical protein